MSARGLEIECLSAMHVSGRMKVLFSPDMRLRGKISLSSDYDIGLLVMLNPYFAATVSGVESVAGQGQSSHFIM